MGAAKTFLLVIALSFGVANAAPAETPVDLTRLRADPQSVTISGISSGAFMAMQFGVAWSSVVKGVGLIAGGPYYCAQVSPKGSQWDFGLPNIEAALGPCMKGPPGPLQNFTGKAEELASAGRIDPLDNLKRQKIYIFHGYNDAVVAPQLGDLTRDFYKATIGETSSVFYQTAIGAGHSFVVAKGDEACPANAAPYIDACGYDQAGVLLQHFYGALVPPTGPSPGPAVRPFDQRPYAGGGLPPDSIGMADQGYVHVPKSCEAGGCRLHVALHGCLQNAEGGLRSEGLAFLHGIGLNEWADRNGIIVLYPQTDPSSGWNAQWGYPPYYQTPFNPNACWDWWGYVNYNDSYVTKSGAQIAAIKAMIDAITHDGASAAPPPAPFALSVSDTSDTGAALAWTAAPNAQSYRISRAGADGVFAPVGETTGLSYADSGLAPNTAYSWRVTPLSGGADLPSANDAKATTRAKPAPCDKPGTCPI